MKAFDQHGVKRSLGLVLAVVMVWFFVAPAVASAEEDELNTCRQALTKCMADAIFSGLLSWGATIFFFLSFCFIGYDFCLKYIDSYA